MRRHILRTFGVVSCVFITLLCTGTAGAASPEIKATVAMQTSGSAATFLGMFFHDSQLGWAVGSGGTILKTIDGGRKWKKMSSGTTALLTAVNFRDARRGWVVGANGITTFVDSALLLLLHPLSLDCGKSAQLGVLSKE